MTSTSLDSIVQTMASEVSRRYRELKHENPTGKIEFSALIMETVKKHGYSGEALVPMLKRVSKEFAQRRRRRVAA